MEKAHFTARDGIKLAYDSYACADIDESFEAKANVVFLHGSTYNTRRYAVIAKALQKQQYIVIYKI